MIPEWAAHLSGPFGAIVALAFGAGSSAGWLFSQRTVLKLANARIDDLRRDLDNEKAECARRIKALEADKDELVKRVTAIEDKYTEGLERQLAQVRLSTRRVRGEETE